MKNTEMDFVEDLARRHHEKMAGGETLDAMDDAAVAIWEYVHQQQPSPEKKHTSVDDCDTRHTSQAVGMLDFFVYACEVQDCINSQ